MKLKKPLKSETNESKKEKENEKMIDLMKKDILIQPQMRFKARTDLERIFDSFPGNYFMDEEKQILIRQLEYLDLYNSKKPKELLKNVDYDNEEEKEDDNKHKIMDCQSKIMNMEQDKSAKILFKQFAKKWAKKTDMNIEAQGVLKDLHVKTHFKAAEEVAEKKSIFLFIFS